MLNYSDVETLRGRGMSNMDILKNMGRVVPSAKQSYDSIVNNKNIPEWQKDALVGRMLDKKVPKKGPSGMGYLSAEMMNESQRDYDVHTADLNKVAEQPRGLLDPVTVESVQANDADQGFMERLGESAVGLGKNVLKSGARLVGGVLEAGVNVLNPDMEKNTVVNLGKLGLGTAANTYETIAGFLGDENAEQIFNAPGEELSSAVGQFYKERYDSSDAVVKTLYEDPVGFMADLLTVVTGGGAAIKGAGKVGEIATAARTAGQGAVALDSAAARLGQLSTGAQRIGTSLTTAPNVSKVVGQVDDAIAPVKEAVGQKMGVVRDAASEKIVARTLKLKPSDRARIELPNVAGQSAEKWLLDRGITGSHRSIANQLDEISSASKAALDEGLSNISKTYDMGIPGSLKAKNNPVKQALNELSKLFDETTGNEDVIAEISELAGKRNLNLTEINQVKRMIDEHIGIYKGTGEVKAGAQARGLSQIRDKLKVFIEDNAADQGFKEVRDLNKTTQVAREIADAMASRAATAGTNRALSLTDFLALGGGATAGGPIGAATVFAIKRIVENPTLRTKFSGMLHSLGADERAVLARTLAGKGGQAGETVLNNLILKTLHRAGVPIGDILNAMEQTVDSTPLPQ